MIHVVFLSNVIPVRDITLGNILELLQLVFHVSCHSYGTIFSLLIGFMVPDPDFFMRMLTVGFSLSYCDGQSSLILQFMALHLL